ncbi:MAG: right-handed parallel beta-helix repeat-containing protein [Candidatus Heimdallarchaeota archaeon]
MKKSLNIVVVIAFLSSAVFGAHAPTSVSTQAPLQISTDFTFTEDIHVTIEVIADNLVIDGNGYTLQGPGPEFSPHFGIYVKGRSGVTIKNIKIKDWRCGIFFNPASNSSISGNIFTNNQRCIWLLRATNNNISGNTLTTNDWGIMIDEGSSNNHIFGNVITEIAGDGILIQNNSNNRFSGNTITNTENGIYFQYTSNNRITGNTITDNEWGLRAYDVSNNYISGNTIANNIEDGIGIEGRKMNNTISSNTITNNGDGIGIGSPNNTISGNTIIANRDGIVIAYSDNCIVGNNISASTYRGIVLIYSYDNLIYHNNIIDNKVQAADDNPTGNYWYHPELLEGNYWSDYQGVDDGSGTNKHAIAGDGIGDTAIPWPRPDFDAYPYVQESGWLSAPTFVTFHEDRFEPMVVTADNTIIDGNGYTLEGPGSGTGIYIKNRSDVIIKNLTITGWKDGIYIDPCTNIIIMNNIITENEFGVNMGEDSSLIKLSNNTISNNQLGIYMRMFCSDITVFNNAISHNQDGIHMEYSSHVTIVFNTISHNHLGVRMWPPTHVTLTDNDIFKNYDGIHMVYSSNVTIFNNLFSMNDNYGIYMENCSDNTIFMNTLIENTNHVFDNRANQFDNGTHGNYWSGYTGSDTNEDGVGETPYLIDTDSIDNYPLIHPLKTLPVVPPTANFTYSPTDPSIRDFIDFIDTSTDADGKITSWEWDFGDGATSMDQNSSHQYTNKGEYMVKLTVTDNDGLSATVEQTITLRNLPPTASFSYSLSSPTVGEEILFTDASFDPDGTISAWAWDFGDGMTSTEVNPTHTYETPRSYPVTLRVTDDEGLEGIFSVTIEVKPKPTEEEAAFIPGFSLEMGILAAIALLGLRKRRQV